MHGHDPRAGDDIDCDERISAVQRSIRNVQKDIGTHLLIGSETGEQANPTTSGSRGCFDFFAPHRSHVYEVPLFYDKV